MSYKPPQFPEGGLSEEATRTRRNLIIILAMWLMIVPLGLTPTKIMLLEIDLTKSAVSVQSLISIAVIYFWVSFIIYAYPGWQMWWHLCVLELRATKLEVERIEKNIKSVTKICEAVIPGKETKYYNFEGEGAFADSGDDLREAGALWIREKLPAAKRPHRQLLTDILMRSVWDYWLPALIIFAPISYFFKAG